jgi:hypothetical protein
LSEDCFRYGSENTASDAILVKAACLYGGALRNVEKEYEDFNQILSNQVSLYAMIFYNNHYLIPNFNNKHYLIKILIIRMAARHW